MISFAQIILFIFTLVLAAGPKTQHLKGFARAQHQQEASSNNYHNKEEKPGAQVGNLNPGIHVVDDINKPSGAARIGANLPGAHVERSVIEETSPTKSQFQDPDDSGPNDTIDVLATVAVDAMEVGAPIVHRKVKKIGHVIIGKIKKKVEHKLHELPGIMAQKLAEKSSAGQLFIDVKGPMLNELTSFKEHDLAKEAAQYFMLKHQLHELQSQRQQQAPISSIQQQHDLPVVVPMKHAQQFQQIANSKLNGKAGQFVGGPETSGGSVSASGSGIMNGAGVSGPGMGSGSPIGTGTGSGATLPNPSSRPATTLSNGLSSSSSESSATNNGPNSEHENFATIIEDDDGFPEPPITSSTSFSSSSTSTNIKPPPLPPPAALPQAAPAQSSGPVSSMMSHHSAAANPSVSALAPSASPPNQQEQATSGGAVSPELSRLIDSGSQLSSLFHQGHSISNNHLNPSPSSPGVEDDDEKPPEFEPERRRNLPYRTGGFSEFYSPRSMGFPPSPIIPLAPPFPPPHPTLPLTTLMHNNNNKEQNQLIRAMLPVGPMNQQQQQRLK